MLRSLLLLVLLLAACTPPAQPLAPVPEPSPTPAQPIVFPRDAGSHNALTEWWYYTGHLRTPGAEPREYGFEFTIFQVRRQSLPVVYLAHFAITDLATGTFSHQARLLTGPPQSGFALDVQGWTLTSDGARDAISAAMSESAGVFGPYALRLGLSDTKPPALHGGGYIDYGAAGGSYYYSRTRLAVAGQLRGADGTWADVEGQAWMDHQWGNFVVAEGGWDWFSLQLNDGSDVMVYVLRGPDGEVSGAYGTHVAPDGSARDLAVEPGQVQATGTWTSPHTGITYPSGWLLRLPGRPDWRLEPKLADQELYFPGEQEAGPIYWEGAVRVLDDLSGQLLGEGYVELTGYTTD